MTAIVLSSDNLSHIKRALRKRLPDFGSAHLSEALAAALGFRSNAALLSRIAEVENERFPEFVLLDGRPFMERLATLGGNTALRIDPTLFDSLDVGSVLVSTAPRLSKAIRYASARDRAWRNMMVAAVNAGLDQKLFSLKTDDNRWPGASVPTPHGRPEGYVYPFVFDNDVPALGYVGDIGSGELSIHVALWPTADGARHVRAFNAGFHVGDAFAAGWVERQDGAWLQSSTTLFNCRKKCLRRIADAPAVKPRGFGDRGRVIM